MGKQSNGVAAAVSIPLYDLAGVTAARLGAAMVLRLGYVGRLAPMAGMAVLAFVRPVFSFWVAVALYAVFQVVWPLLSVASNDLAASLAPFGEGPALGLFSAAAAVGSAFGALAGGVIADRLGYAAVLAFAAVAIAVALLTVRQKAASQR